MSTPYPTFSKELILLGYDYLVKSKFILGSEFAITKNGKKISGWMSLQDAKGFVKQLEYRINNNEILN